MDSNSLGNIILVNVCHGPVVKEMKLKKEVILWLNENCGKEARNISEFFSNKDTGWYINDEIIKKPRKNSKLFDEVVRIHVRNEEMISLFFMTFSVSGTSTSWGSDL